MNMLPIERIFVPLQHGSKDRRDIVLPAVAGRQRLAGRVFREERGQREHIRHSPLFEAGGDSSREEVPDIRFPSGAHMAASGLVAVPDIHHEIRGRFLDHLICPCLTCLLLHKSHL